MRHTKIALAVLMMGALALFAVYGFVAVIYIFVTALMSVFAQRLVIALLPGVWISRLKRLRAGWAHGIENGMMHIRDSERERLSEARSVWDALPPVGKISIALVLAFMVIAAAITAWGALLALSFAVRPALTSWAVRYLLKRDLLVALSRMAAAQEFRALVPAGLAPLPANLWRWTMVPLAYALYAARKKN